MDKGIQKYAHILFAEQNELRRQGTEFTGLKGNTAFRKHVMSALMDAFSIPLTSASTHYNSAFKALKALDPNLVTGLGRPDDKKGGRKPKVSLTGKEVVESQEQTIFTVKKKSDGSVIAAELSFKSAKEMVERAAKAKKSRLYWV